MILLIGGAVIVLGVVATRLGWIDLSDKTKRGKPSGAAVMMIGDEVFAPRKYEAQVEVDRQARLPVPAPVPGDGDQGISYAAAGPKPGVASSPRGASGGASGLAGTSTGPLADGDGNKMMALEISRPRKRYLKCVIDRGTANAVIDGMIAIQYNGRSLPPTQAASMAFTEIHASPDEGTA